MKIRTDFVTNSSSSGFVVIRINLHNKKEISISRTYDSGYGGYFWNSFDGEREILKYRLSTVCNGQELLAVLDSGINEFDSFILGTDTEGAQFRSEILNIQNFSDIKTIYIAEETDFDGDERKSAELRVNNKATATSANTPELETVPVQYIRKSLAEAQQDWTVKVGKKGVTLSKYSGMAYELTIPAFVDDLPVVAIKGTPGKKLYVGIVNIPDTVKEVDAKAFRGIKSIKKVNIASEKTVIRPGAFYGCTGLEDENGCIIVAGVLHQCNRKGLSVISPGISKIPHRLAWGEFPTVYTYQMTSLVIPEGVEVIESEAFCGQNSLEAVILPSTLKEIGEGAFAHCHSLRRIVLPEGIRKIGDRAFYDCRSMVAINFPAALEQIGEEAFACCSNLHAPIPNHVAQVGNNAFYGCHSMADSNGMTIVKNMLHNYCGTASKVKIPDEVEYIADYCFIGHNEIEEIELPKSLKKIGTLQHTCCSYTFRGCSGLADENGFVVVGECLWDYIGDAEIVKIPEGVTMIHEKAIRNPKGSEPKTVIVPATVTHISTTVLESGNVQFLGDMPEILPVYNWYI